MTAALSLDPHSEVLLVSAAAAAFGKSLPRATRQVRRSVGRSLGTYSRYDLIKKIGVHRISLEEAERRAAARDLRIRQTDAICDRLLKSGIDLRRKDVGNVVAIGAVSGEVIAVPDSYKNCNFLPAMQHLHGSKKRSELGSYLANHPKGQYAQYFVLTNGERCDAHETRERLSSANRALSKFVHRARSEFPWVEFVARMNEVTVNADKLVHPHVNLCVIFHQVVEKSELIAFTEGLRAALGGWVHNARRIRSVDEFIKYTTKFGIIIDENGDERGSATHRDHVMDALQPDLFDVSIGKHEDILAVLFQQQHHARAFAAFSEFAEYRRALRENRLVPKRLGDDYALVKMSPYRARQQTVEGADRAAQIQAENLFLAVATPHPHGVAGTLIEPTLRVIGYSESPSTDAGRERLAVIQKVQETLREALLIEPPEPETVPLPENVISLAAARAARAEREYIVHTDTLSVPISSLITSTSSKIEETPGSGDAFDAIDGTRLWIHRSSLSVFDDSNLPSTAQSRERAGFSRVTYSSIPLVSPDPIHAARLKAWAEGLDDEPGPRWTPPRVWNQYELAI